MTGSSQSQTVGGYELTSEIGRGANTVVYRAVDKEKQDVAVKLFPRGLLLDPTYADYFVEIVGRLAAFKHPRVIPILDYGNDQEQLFMITRAMPGGSLHGRLQKGPFSPTDALDLIHRVSEGLAAAHAQGIVHGGVQPHNILFDETGEPYLADFGIFTLFQYASGSTTSFAIGSPAYYCPEQALGMTLVPQSDVYSMAIVLFEMLAGRTPYDSTGPPVLVAQRHVTDPIPSIRRARPDLPEACEPVMARAFNKVPEERFSSVGAFMQAFAGALEQAPPPASAAGAFTPEPGASGPGPNRTWIAIAIGAVLVVVVLIGLVLAFLPR